MTGFLQSDTLVIMKHSELKAKAIEAINALYADGQVSSEETRCDLADLSNHIDDFMRLIDASETELEERLEHERMKEWQNLSYLD